LSCSLEWRFFDRRDSLDFPEKLHFPQRHAQRGGNLFRSFAAAEQPQRVRAAVQIHSRGRNHRTSAQFTSAFCFIEAFPQLVYEAA
jgi:hypothetical protein